MIYIKKEPREPMTKARAKRIVRELLDIEERNQIASLTTQERKEFQYIVNAWMEENMLTDQVMLATNRLLSCFPGSKFREDIEPLEFIYDKDSDSSFIIGRCKTKLDIDCQVLEYISKAASKKSFHYEDIEKNNKFHKKMLNGINAYFGTTFSGEDISIISDCLGKFQPMYDRNKTIEFIKSGFDMKILYEMKEKHEAILKYKLERIKEDLDPFEQEEDFLK